MKKSLVNIIMIVVLLLATIGTIYALVSYLNAKSSVSSLADKCNEQNLKRSKLMVNNLAGYEVYDKSGTKGIQSLQFENYRYEIRKFSTTLTSQHLTNDSDFKLIFGLKPNQYIEGGIIEAIDVYKKGPMNLLADPILIVDWSTGYLDNVVFIRTEGDPSLILNQKVRILAIVRTIDSAHQLSSN